MTIWTYRSTEPEMPALLERNASTVADKTSLWIDGRVVTHQQVLARSVALANGYRDLGLGSGDLVATFAANCEEIAYSFHASWYTGGIHASLNTALRGAFLLQQLTTARPKALLTDADLLPRILEVADGLDFLEHVIIKGPSTTTAAIPFATRACCESAGHSHSLMAATSTVAS